MVGCMDMDDVANNHIIIICEKCSATLFFRQQFRLIVNSYRQLSGDIDRRYRYWIGDVEDRAD